jgi:hypothetical protein
MPSKRKVLICLGMLCLQMLEGFGVVVTFVRGDIKAFHRMWPSYGPFWIQSVWAWSALITFAVQGIILGLITIIPLGCVANLMPLNKPIDARGGKLKELGRKRIPTKVFMY